MTTTLDQIRRPIEAQIEEFKAFVRKNFSEEQGTLIGDMLEYVLSSRGKGLRPVVVMLQQEPPRLRATSASAQCWRLCGSR